MRKLLKTAGLVAAVLLIALLVWAMRRAGTPGGVRVQPKRLTYSIYCVNDRYVLSARPLARIDTGGDEDPCVISEHDSLLTAGDAVSQLGGVGAHCSCNKNRRYVYCIKRRVEVRDSPARGEPAPDFCELPEEEAEDEDAERKAIKDAADMKCECPKAGGDVEAAGQGVGWVFIVACLAIFATFLVFLRRQPQREEPPDTDLGSY